MIVSIPKISNKSMYFYLLASDSLKRIIVFLAPSFLPKTETKKFTSSEEVAAIRKLHFEIFACSRTMMDFASPSTVNTSMCD